MKKIEHQRRTEREGERERQKEREVCFVTVGGTSQREKATEIKSGAAINAISEFKIEKYRYVYAKKKGKIKKQPTILVIERNTVTYQS